MIGRVGWHKGCGLAAMIAAIAVPGTACAQEAPPQTPAPAPVPPAESPMLDPDSPLAPLPELGVDWPDLSKVDATATDGTAKTDIAELTRYEYRIEGIEGITDALFLQRFNSLSALKAHVGDPSNAAQIDRRAREDVTLLQTLLRGIGYYDARISTSISAESGKPRVTLLVEPGTQYKLDTVSTPGLAAAGEVAPALRDALGVGVDDPVDADKIAGGTAELRAQLGERGFPFATVEEPSVVIDHATGKATLNVAVEPGGVRVFGRIVTPPNKLFDARHIQQIARFKPGETYNATALDDLRRALIQTGIVSSAEVKPVEGEKPGTVDIAVALQPAPPRTIAGELGYGTGEGIRAEVDWTHRNLFPPEGALTLRGVAGTQEQSASVIFRRNNFQGRDRVLTAQLAGANINRPAFQARTFSLSGSLERQTTIFFQKKWTWSLGAELAASDERDVIITTGASRRRTFFIASLPTSLSYDGSDDLLNPTKGFRLGGRLSPELSLQGSVFGYARIQFDASAYKSLGERVVLAGRVRLGTILGAPRDAIAPSRRFYAGGGASVRGYGFQAIGPRDPNNDPIGGRSLTEFSLEARIKAFGPFGIVPFFDAGNIYTSDLPKFSDLQYGAGVGLRYYSNFGPIRIDVGTPINPQRGDPRIAVYVSLGQAF
ncbi:MULTISPECIES: autotransporter assembly complex protein TamA [Sphingomonas]|uniref:autotransporter assembly complex protein TamA n=1 Tax=Sphingomonas TaxID=13687 RepID=UPI0009E7A0A9|nr:autotransporter assembly complex family protein [Sphingomonas sp. CCH10-B3]